MGKFYYDDYGNEYPHHNDADLMGKYESMGFTKLPLRDDDFCESYLETMGY